MEHEKESLAREEDEKYWTVADGGLWFRGRYC
jgi:hypothetical protein